MLDTLNCLYFSLVGVGVMYALLVLITGGLHDLSGSLHLPFDIGGGHGGAPDISHGDLNVPSLSPITVASFVTAFGAFGIIARQGIGTDSGMSVVWAAAGGFIVALIAHFAFGYFLIAPQGSTEVTQKDIVGALAEVVTPIPAGGMGEVAFVAQGGRVVYPARSASGQAIGRGAPVTIVELVGTIVSVRLRNSSQP